MVSISIHCRFSLLLSSLSSPHCCRYVLRNKPEKWSERLVRQVLIAFDRLLELMTLLQVGWAGWHMDLPPPPPPHLPSLFSPSTPTPLLFSVPFLASLLSSLSSSYATPLLCYPRPGSLCIYICRYEVKFWGVEPKFGSDPLCMHPCLLSLSYFFPLSPISAPSPSISPFPLSLSAGH